MAGERASRRLSRAQRLLKTYIRYHTGRLRRLSLQRRRAQAASQKEKQPTSTSKSPSISSFSDLSTTTSDCSDSSSEDVHSTDTASDTWADILGPDWRFADIPTLGFSDVVSVDMPTLRSVGSSESSSDIEFGSGSEGDDEDSDDFELDEMDIDSASSDSDTGQELPPSAKLRTWVHSTIEDMYSKRYEQSRNQLPRGPSYLAHVLTTLKNGRPDHFRTCLRVTPLTFDKIVAKIIDDPVFQNNSRNPQAPVEEQLAVTLYRFGHDGNAASLQGIANWAGLGKGTVHKYTRRVMTAILRPQFMNEAVRLPTPEEKEAAKAWVEKHSCKAWRHGWCFVDGTLVPLCNRPYWFGESYFDRKCNYSLNFQVGFTSFQICTSTDLLIF